MRKSRYDEMCGLRQIAVSWAICVLCTGFAEARPRPLLKNIGHDILEQGEEWSPCVISRRISTLLSIPLMRFWRRSRTEGLYLYHVQRFQHLELADTGGLLEYCHWINVKPMLRNILFTDEVHFTRNGVDSVRHTSQGIMMIYTEQSEVNTSKHAVWTNCWTIHVSSASDGKYFCNTKCQSSESKFL
jgi:hypothetical protein